MAVRARLLAMKKAKAEKEAAAKAATVKVVIHQRRNIFAKSESPRATPKRFKLPEPITIAENDDDDDDKPSRATWPVSLSSAENELANKKSEHVGKGVDEEEDSVPLKMRHFTRPKITKRRKKSIIQPSKAFSMKTVLPSSPAAKRASLEAATIEAPQAGTVGASDAIDATDAIGATEVTEVTEVTDATGASEDAGYDDSVPEWYYVDDSNETQGPYDGKTIASWDEAGYLDGKVVSNWRFSEGDWMSMEDARPFFVQTPDDDDVPSVPESLAGNTSLSSTIGDGEDTTATSADMTIVPADIKSKSSTTSKSLSSSTTSSASLPSTPSPSTLSIPPTSSTLSTPPTASTTSPSAAVVAISTKTKNTTNTTSSSPLISLAELLSSLSLKRDVELYDVAVLACDLKKQLKASEKTIASLQQKLSTAAGSSKMQESSTTATIASAPKEKIVEPVVGNDGGGENSSFRKRLRRQSIAIKNKSKLKISSVPPIGSRDPPSKIKPKVTPLGAAAAAAAAAAVTSTPLKVGAKDLMVIRDHQGNEIRIHGDGRVRISSKRSTDFDAPPPEPDMTSFDLTKKVEISDLWNAANAALDVARQAKTRKKKSLEATTTHWTFFFRTGGKKIVKVGAPVPAENIQAKNLQDALVSAELSQPTSPLKTLSKKKERNDVESVAVNDGGGENSSFRTRLRRQSIAIKSKMPVRRKSYALKVETIQDTKRRSASTIKKQHGRMRSFSEKSEENDGDIVLSA